MRGEVPWSEFTWTLTQEQKQGSCAQDPNQIPTRKSEHLTWGCPGRTLLWAAAELKPLQLTEHLSCPPRKEKSQFSAFQRGMLGSSFYNTQTHSYSSGNHPVGQEILYIPAKVLGMTTVHQNISHLQSGKEQQSVYSYFCIYMGCFHIKYTSHSKSVVNNFR